MYYIPQKNMPDNIKAVQLPVIGLNQPLTPEENRLVQELYNKYFPEMIEEFYQLTLVDNEQIYYYNTNMWISILIAVISSVDLALIMNYILTRRRKTLAIFRINGCGVNRARRLYITEIMLVLNAVFIVCFAVWRLLLLPALDGIFPYIAGAFSAKIYVLIYVCYMAVSYIVMNIMTIRYMRRSPVDLLKRR